MRSHILFFGGQLDRIAFFFLYRFSFGLKVTFLEPSNLDYCPLTALTELRTLQPPKTFDGVVLLAGVPLAVPAPPECRHQACTA